MATIADLLNDARYVLQDSTVPYRHTDDRMVKTLNSALREAFRLRPDLFLSAGFVIPEYTTADLTSPPSFPLEEQWYTAFVDFIVGYIELSDDEFTIDGRAVAMLNMFKKQLTGLST